KSLNLQNPKINRVVDALSKGDQNKLAELGIDVGYTWIDDIVIALITGTPFVEIEVVRPAAIHHVDKRGVLDVRSSSLAPDECAGILLAAVFRDVFHGCADLRLVVPLDDVSEEKISLAQRDRFVVEIAQLLSQHGVILFGDIPGKHFNLIRESDSVPV